MTTLSRLIKKLVAIQTQHGDMDVVFDQMIVTNFMGVTEVTKRRNKKLPLDKIQLISPKNNPRLKIEN